ncbi:hypothetical protein VNI00_006200 [Paramarasmius palmivorus]|uniref:Uncharacterized protein n=1 Tax=Paramarasmius palmivorus TaxID=297713 RepID=A0AAW0D947_9AGAR
MIFSKKPSTAAPEAFHKCSNRKCNYQNAPKPASGTYHCHGCSKGTYKVSSSQAASVDALGRRPFHVYPQVNPARQVATRSAPPPRVVDDLGFNPNAMIRTPPPRQEPTVHPVQRGRDQYKAEQRMAKNLESWGEPLSRSGAVKKKIAFTDIPTASSAHSHGHGYSATTSTRQYNQAPPTRHYVPVFGYPAPVHGHEYSYRTMNVRV